MTAFDTDVLSDLFLNAPAVVARVAAVPADDQYVPVVGAEEILRGRLNAIRHAQAGGKGLTVDQAYAELAKSLADIRRLKLLAYPPAAEALFQAWRAAKIRIGTRDLRIAASCLAQGAKLVTRNGRDFAQVPGLNLEIWN